MRLLLRADAGPATGVGHVVRAMALAEAAAAGGHEAVLSGAIDGLPWLERELAASGVQMVAPASTGVQLAALARRVGADAVHVDHYVLPIDLQSALRAEHLPLSNVEDFEFGRRRADLVIDPNLGAGDQPRAADGSGVLLRGARYALLRERVLRARAGRTGEHRAGGHRGERAAPGGRRSVLVLMGGTDATGALEHVVRALVATGVPSDVTVIVPSGTHGRLAERAAQPGAGGVVAVRLVAPRPDITDAMATADVVVSAAGTTVWELAAIGVPTALVQVVDNQAAGYAAVVRAGVALGLGDASAIVDTEATATALRALLTDDTRREEFAATARSVVDGLGSWRVIKAVERMTGGRLSAPGVAALASAQQLSSRAATLEDAALLAQWRNDRLTREQSRRSDPIPWPAHLVWLRRVLADPCRLLLVVTADVPDDTAAVGTARWDALGDAAWEVSVTVAPERRGAGLSLPLLLTAERALRGYDPSARHAEASVHVGNQPSLRLFASAGYLPDAPADAAGFARFRKAL